MVSHVVVLAEVVIIALNDRGGVHTGDVVALRIELDETVEAVVDEGEEVGHAQKGLEIDPKHKGRRAGHN
jgi:hypothetical protein